MGKLLDQYSETNFAISTSPIILQTLTLDIFPRNLYNSSMLMKCLPYSNLGLVKL